MHNAALQFVKSVKQRYPTFFDGSNVVEFGSLNINGSIRGQFTNCNYIGVDLGQGKNVDVVSVAHEYQHKGNPPDVVVSMEMLEHDPFWFLSLKKMVDLLRPDGLLIVTASGAGRLEHGTIKTTPGNSPLTCGLPTWANYYRNLGLKELTYALEPDSFFSEFEIHCGNKDVYFFGIKKANAD